MMEKGHEDYSRTHEVKTSGNRAFGWVFVVVFLIIGAWPLLSGGSLRGWATIAAAVIALAALAAPALLSLPNRGWMRFGMLLHRIVSPLVLAILFFAIVTPMGLIMRMFGHDSLHLRRRPGEDSYWIKRDPPGPKPDSLNHQF